MVYSSAYEQLLQLAREWHEVREECYRVMSKFGKHSGLLRLATETNLRYELTRVLCSAVTCRHTKYVFYHAFERKPCLVRRRKAPRDSMAYRDALWDISLQYTRVVDKLEQIGDSTGWPLLLSPIRQYIARILDESEHSQMCESVQQLASISSHKLQGLPPSDLFALLEETYREKLVAIDTRWQNLQCLRDIRLDELVAMYENHPSKLIA